MIWTRISLLVTALTAFTALLAAQAGTLDATFGTAGTDQQQFSLESRNMSCAVQADGKIVVAGSQDESGPSGPGYQDRLVVTRYNVSGTLDTTFGPGANGIARFDVGDGSGWGRIALTSSGNILVMTRNALLQLTPAGNLDPTFGTAGIVVYNSLAYNWGKKGAPTSVFPAQIALQSSGAILLAGAGGGQGGNSSPYSVIRLFADGTPDFTYGSNGFAIASGGYGALGTMDTQGRFILARTTSLTNSSEWKATRFTADGNVDTTFGETQGRKRTGTLLMDLPPATSLSYGVHLVTGAANELYAVYTVGDFWAADIAIKAWDSSGDPLLAFGTSGQAMLPIVGPSFGIVARSVCIDAAGRFVISGHGGDNTTTPVTTDAYVIRVLPNGSPDASFGVGGVSAGLRLANSSASSSAFTGFLGVAMDGSGNILAVGTTNDPFGTLPPGWNHESRALIARYNG